MNLAARLGRLRGGAAKVSGFFGAVRLCVRLGINRVASTGAITLPAMRVWVIPSPAGAVEAVASSGEQIIPPRHGGNVLVEL